MVRTWRIANAGNAGWLTMVFDPRSEMPSVRKLTAGERTQYLDSLVSVSAPDEDEDGHGRQLDIDLPKGVL